MTTLFDSLKIGDLELKNRIVMAPMTRSRADEDGIQSELAAKYYEQRSAGGGLLISEAVNISPMAKGYPRTPGIYTDEQIAAWQKVSAAVHAAGGKIFMQIFHTGRIALPDFLPNRQKPVAPSAVAAKGQNYTDSGMKDFVEPRELESEEIKAIVQGFCYCGGKCDQSRFCGRRAARGERLPGSAVFDGAGQSANGRIRRFN